MKRESWLLRLTWRHAVRRLTSTYVRSIGALATLAASLLIVAFGSNVRADGNAMSFQSGDYIITQESPEERQSAGSQSAGSFIFYLAQSGEMRTIASPPAIAGPRGIRALASGQFVFADVKGASIRIMNSQGNIRTTTLRGFGASEMKGIIAKASG